MPGDATCATIPGELAIDYGPITLVCAHHAAAGTAAGDDTRPAEPGALMAIGCDSGAGDTDGPRLRAAEREARRVGAQWHHGRVEVRTGASAAWHPELTRAMAGADVIHIASHAVVHRGDPSGTVLRLSGPDNDTPVTVDAVLALTLRAELVYLSCCEAAGGRADAADGATDFAGAFLRAGARAVVAAPVRLDDTVAEAAALAFYRHWRPGLEPSQALRAAMLELRQGAHAHPGTWSFLRVLTAA